MTASARTRQLASSDFVNRHSDAASLLPSHQIVHILCLANDRCLGDCDLVVARTLLMAVLVRPNFYSALCLATVQFSSPFVRPTYQLLVTRHAF